MNAQCSEKLNGTLSRVFEIGSEEVRKKKEKGWRNLRENAEAIGEDTSEICNALVGLVPERKEFVENKASIEADSDENIFSRDEREEKEAVEEVHSKHSYHYTEVTID